MRLPSLLALISASVAIASPAMHLKKRATCPGGQTVDDAQCCVWFDVLDDLQAKVFNNGKCQSGVRKALRLSFHDAIGFSNSLTASGSFGGGGADGSIIEHARIELTFEGNEHFPGLIAAERAIALAHNVSFADIIQFGAAAGVTNCPGSPRLEFLAGRPFTSRPSPRNLLPGEHDSVDAILRRMADAGFSADETVDLLASHSVATHDGVPLDTTPNKFDTQFFIETLLKNVSHPEHGEDSAQTSSHKSPLQSDFAIARDPRTSCRWQELGGNPALMRTAFRASMVKVALLGQDRGSLVDCSSIIPSVKVDNAVPTLPHGKVAGDIEGSCAATPLPSLPTAAEPAPTVAL